MGYGYGLGLGYAGLGYAGYGGYGLGYSGLGYGYGLGYYGKRSADAEPEAKADAGLLYGGYGYGLGLGYAGLGYAGYGYAVPMLVLATDTVLDTTARDPLMPNPKLRPMLVFSMEDTDMVLDSDTPVLDMPVLAMVMVDTVLDTEVSTMVKKQYFKAHKSSNAICLQFSACFGRN